MSFAISEKLARQVAKWRREIDSVMVGGIMAVGVYLALGVTGLDLDAGSLSALAGKFLGISAPLFAAAGAFLLWVCGALVVELAGLTDARRRWDGIAAALFYLENAAPFVGLLECFISIVKALLAYADAGASAAAQSVLIANIAVALGASAVGCFVALIAHSLKAVLNHRMARP
ncbi:MAG: MotA/TolQ/ExbB proton channel family protein [Rhodospirillaceae bacterium]